MLGLIFLAVQAIFALFFFYLCLAFLTGAPFVPSSRQTSQKMMELAQVSPGLKVYDLGSGEGRLLFLAAQKGALATGYEINPFLVLLTKLRVFGSPHQRQIRVYWRNFWRADIRDADVVFIYLLPWKMTRIYIKTLRKQNIEQAIVTNAS